MDGVGGRFWGWGAFGAVMALRLAVIGAETGHELAYLRQTEFMILNNDAVSGFFAQKFGRFCASSASPPPHGDDRSDSARLAHHGLACTEATARVASHVAAYVDLPPTTYHLPPTAYGPPPTAHRLLPTAYCLLPTACAPPPAPGPRLRRRPAGSGRLRSACCRWSSRHPPGPGAGRPRDREPAR